jgi:hypothetical protein
VRDLVFLCDWLPPDFGAVAQYALQYASERASGGEDVVLYGLTSGESSIELVSIGGDKLKIVRLHAPTYSRASLRERAWWTLKTNLMLVNRALPDIRHCRELMFTGSPPFLLHVVAPLNLFLRRKLGATLLIGAPDRASQSIRRPICAREGVLFIPDANNRHDRSELLLIDYPSTIFNVTHNGWFNEIAESIQGLATTADNAIRFRILQITKHLFVLHSILKGSETRLGIVRVTDGCSPGSSD